MAVESFNQDPITDLVPRQSSRRSHTIFVALQKEIVLGVLAPERTLTELDLAQRFGCSQGTVREALMQLNEEGLVKRQPNRGTRVAPCPVDDARALLSLRSQVECSHLDRVIARADSALTADLRALLDAMRNAARDCDEYALSVRDRAFHTRLFEAADLPLVSPILTRCLIHAHRFKILNSQPNRALEETAERHRPIIEALEARDLDQLRELLAHHIATIVDFGPDLTGDVARSKS
ncbi:GntR family transcriptional regulator [Allosediminivita pacifica]|uniref:GntR family transcriptional regulator n=1 Tax=Allosediminivita pacifica TaxID=1267769 RepID=A0A2T6AJ21_9RHOB|nr:GntR family transcriptional regulator [Allosediminivita pacifica]PTX43813.1 GntR family transcriptional regulator [Allosediminivita pacifica]GGB21991.1 GntR family transcriptional regulator [Allosediminivita pacifica]